MRPGEASKFAPRFILGPPEVGSPCLFSLRGLSGLLRAPPHAQTIDRGRECQVIVKSGHNGRHLRVHGREEFERPPKKRPLKGGFFWRGKVGSPRDATLLHRGEPEGEGNSPRFILSGRVTLLIFPFPHSTSSNRRTWSQPPCSPIRE